ncbi:MAG: DEAD/DEAH box helicase [Alphaproteobacteria bacterium]|nr:DEAD/DEAH box helicase [Alphaproteobacteria bacterium]
MTYVPDNPLIAQSDHTLLLETQSPRFEEARDALLAFAELVKSPEYIHTWRITSLSLWNAAAAGHTADAVIDTLARFAKYPIPDNVPATIRDKMARYGRVRLVRDGAWLRLEADDPVDVEEIRHLKETHDLFGEDPGDPHALRVLPRKRGEVKQVLTALGHPVQDLAGYDDGDPLTMALAPTLPDGRPWALRDYQIEAIDAFHGGPGAGSGVVVLPCGAGKTMVGIGAMVRLGMRTLILCTGHTALQQWRREILERTSLTEDQVGAYTAESKQLAPVTLTTYQLLTWRPSRNAPPAHFRLFHEASWGLVIYDEVHLLPAPIFRESAYLQARRRLGLTATLVREDGHEGDVFALIGPKRFDLPWKALEHQGWIATARCIEVRVALSPEDRLRMVTASAKERYRIAAHNARKGAILDKLLARHADEQVLVLGTYLDHLGFLARRFGIPVISGDTPLDERRALYQRFRDGELRVLALSKVGNFSVDLPGASVAIQVSGSWGSRQEEAQRLGRVLRPKAGQNQAWFYSLVTADSPEQEYAERRQLFLTEQGYPYRIERAS